MVKGAGLGKKEINRTVKFIKDNNKSGGKSVIAESVWVYNNCIAIEPSATNRQEMVDIVSQDNGKGGTAAANNREYGGYINSANQVVAVEPGPVTNPMVDSEASISNMMGVSTFHCHNSGELSTSQPSAILGIGSMSGTTINNTQTTAKYIQPPSPTDISIAGNNTHYVFAMGDKKVYVYTKDGVQAVMNISQFVNPKR